MKNKILILSLLLGTASSIADSGRIFFGEAHSAISADGQWIAGQLADGSVVIRHLPTDEEWFSLSDGGNTNYYIGHGLSMSNIGVLAGSTTTSNAAYWEKGVWRVLPGASSGYICNAVSITPDGGIICGGIGMQNMTDDAESTMLFPALWYRQEDGRYGEPVLLPHPRHDITGRAPQYITAIAISDDGKRVAGQMMDYTGVMTELIVYECGEDGEWSYRLLGRDYLNPGNIVFPQWPGSLADDIVMPSQEWFMDQEQIDAFVEVMNEWDYTGEMPRYEDFMTEEQIRQYQEAVKEYYDKAIPWREKYDEFMEVYQNYRRAGTSFYYNNCRLSPDGKYYVNSASLDKTHGGGTHTVVFDLETGEDFIVRSEKPVAITSIAADYTLLGHRTSSESGSIEAYIFPQMKEGGMLLEDYIKAADPDLYDWMEGNLVQDVITSVDVSGKYSTIEMMCIGIPVSTPDLKYILANNSTANWLDESYGPYVSVYLPLASDGKIPDTPQDNGVEEIENVTAFRMNGNILCVGSDIKTVEIYDVAGRKISTIPVNSETVDTGLKEGIFILKGIRSDNSVLTLKVVL